VAKFAVIVPAAGKSSRFADKNYKKPFAPLANSSDPAFKSVLDKLADRAQ